jgi:hypothetical protein
MLRQFHQAREIDNNDSLEGGSTALLIVSVVEGGTCKATTVDGCVG